MQVSVVSECLSEKRSVLRGQILRRYQTRVTAIPMSPAAILSCMRITAVHGDITEQAVDAIVNAANSAIRGGGGVDGAIHRAGGPAILQDCIHRFPEGLATGDAGWTTAGDLPARWVIHTVGPNYAAGQQDRGLLQSCYRRALEVADELGAATLAFPLISAGIYGWPLVDAIATAIYALAGADTRVEEARLVAYDDQTFRALEFRLMLATPIRIMQGVRVLHERGYHRVRAMPGMSPSGAYWRITITAAENQSGPGGNPSGGKAAAVGYSSSSRTEFNGAEVTATTPLDDVADVILAGLPQAQPSGDDPAYVAWYADLMGLVEREATPPIAYADYSLDGNGWQINGADVMIIHPHPPSRPS
jgi:O-acetyl-ADP-ribose deacetylase (regulator of RNase III)